MSSRPTHQSKRLARFVRASQNSFDSLEPRFMMSASPVQPSGSLCMCAACVSARAAISGDNTANASATIKPLSSLSSLSKAVRTAVARAGADLFKGTSDLSKSANGHSEHELAKSLTPFTLNLTGLKSRLASAPAEFTLGAANAALQLAIPMPDGTLARFKVVRSEVMDPALARQFPSIRTYRGVGIDDRTADIRLDTTDAGFHAQILSPKGSFYIDPFFVNDAQGAYVSYYKSDAIRTAAWKCSVSGSGISSDTALEAAQADGQSFTPSIVYGGTLKTYRAAVAGNRPYVTAATTGVAGGATVTNGVAAVVTAMNRVTGVYETELGIRMTLVANEAAIVYGTDNPSADPYTNSTAALNQNTSNLNSVIGSANYDIGHVFTTGSGGVAQLGCVGGSNKGAGTTGTPSPVGDSFTIDYVAHEMGHQFGANHTFNTSGDAGNRSGAHAYEPGSGLSIMAYAGIEGADDLAGHSIANFHSESIDEIRTFISNSIPGVGVSSSTGDTAPSVNAGADYAIPTGTPFALTATGSDLNGDTLSYDWQERDKGGATLLSTADNGVSPLFTEIAPSTSATRTLPRLNSILGGFANTVAGGTGASAANVLGAGTNTVTARLAERMYAVSRSASTWRVTARDNRGGVSTDDLVLTVVNTGSAFGLTTLNGALVLSGGSTQTLTWTVANTTAAPINAANVKISLSTDGGQTFPTVLAASTANDGSEAVQLPYNTGTSTARIKIEAVGNIFFDINNANFTITNVAVPSSATPGVPFLSATSDSGVSSSDGLTNRNNSSDAKRLQISVPGTIANALVELRVDGRVIDSVIATGTTTVFSTTSSTIFTSDGSTVLADGNHAFTARQTESGRPVSAVSSSGTVAIDTAAPATPSAISLDSASDTGVSNSDTITNDATPTISVTVPETYLRLTRDGSFVTGDYATSTSFTDSPLTDGTHTYTVQSVDAAGNVSVATLPLSIVVDTVAPTLAPLSDRFGFETAQTLAFVFSGANGSTIDPSDVSVVSTGTPINPTSVSYDPATGTALFSFSTLLPDGNYTATLASGGVTDDAGNATGSDVSSFFVLAGDANRDRKVDFADLLILAQNFGSANKPFSSGNFNYSADGLVDFADLLILAQQFGSTLAPGIAAKGGGVSQGAKDGGRVADSVLG